MRRSRSTPRVRKSDEEFFVPPSVLELYKSLECVLLAPVRTAKAMPLIAPPTAEPQGGDDTDDEDILRQMQEREKPPPTAIRVYDENFNVEEAAIALHELRNSMTYSSCKILTFAKELWDAVPEMHFLIPPHVAELLTVEALVSRGNFGGKMTPTIGGRKRLFGELELHHRVLGVLNKVTNDRSKYQQVRNELFRLPIPEADPESLHKVVHVFFQKAVAEQRFSSHYADLVAELCTVPKGQLQVGNFKDSFSYHLRRTLLRACQEYFEAPRVHRENVERECTSEDEIEERLRREKDNLCGNVKFVGELYLRNIVAPSIIELILLRLFFGATNTDQLRLESRLYYVPSDLEFDQVLTLLKTTGKTFAATTRGRALLPHVHVRARYFSVHHTVPRVRFLMQDLVDLMTKTFDLPKGDLIACESPKAELPKPANAKGLASIDKPSSPVLQEDPKIPQPRSRKTANKVHAAPTPSVTSTPVMVAPISPPPAIPTDVPSLMTRIANHSDAAELEALVRALVQIPSGVVAYARRAINTIRCDKERQYMGVVLSTAVKLGHNVETLRREIVGIMRDLIEDEAYLNNGRLWKLWAQVVASDKEQTVLDPSVHGDVLSCLAEDAAIAAKFAHDVILYNNSSEDFVAGVISPRGWQRFRPLSVFRSRTDKSEAWRAARIAALLEDDAIDLELMAHAAATSGKPARALFDSLRVHPHLQHPQAPAKVLSGIYLAPLGEEMLRDYTTCLSTIVDGQQRHLREAWLLMELPHVIGDHKDDVVVGRCLRQLIDGGKVSQESLVGHRSRLALPPVYAEAIFGTKEVTPTVSITDRRNGKGGRRSP